MIRWSMECFIYCMVGDYIYSNIELVSEIGVFYVRDFAQYENHIGQEPCLGKGVVNVLDETFIWIVSAPPLWNQY